MSPRDLAAFVAARTATLDLPDGTAITVRPATPDDRQYLLEGLSRLSERSIYTRFLRPVPHLSESEITHLLSVDQTNHFAWAAFHEGHPVGVARYIRDADRPEYAEAAVTVVDDYQRRGIGRMLVELLAQSAQANGIKHFLAYVGVDNELLADALTQAGARVLEENEYAITLVFDLPLPVDFDNSTLRAALRAVAMPTQD